jgi:hypothetical protein
VTEDELKQLMLEAEALKGKVKPFWAEWAERMRAGGEKAEVIYTKIAERFGWTPGTVRTKLKRFRKSQGE